MGKSHTLLKKIGDFGMEGKDNEIYERFLNQQVIVDVAGKDRPVVGNLIHYSDKGIVIRLKSGQETVIPESKVLTCKGYVGKEGGADDSKAY